MKTYPALKFVSGLYRFVAILASGALIFASAVSGNIIMVFVGSLFGLIVGASIYAMGELIMLLIRIGNNTEKASTHAEKTNIALLNIYRSGQKQDKPRKPIQRLSERKRA